MILNPLQRLGLSDLTRRLLSEEGHLDSFSPELQLNWILALERPEWRIWMRENLWVFRATVAAAAGNVSHIETFAPANSGLIVVVTNAEVVAPGANPYSLRFQGAAGGAPVPNDVRDARITFPQDKAISQNRIANNTVGPSGIIVGQEQGPSAGAPNVKFSVGLPFVLFGGPVETRLAVWCETVNVGLTVVMQGYEYQPVLPQELQVP